ncbi:hypothetical protein F0919_09175 [Taibaiella lutea]|uniref:Uncharacterized protein n=2 Tax=Taibaiella lutea TaxID=2608001 RepID=A0A5M6CNP5_9BACT|nr:hypothetical protein F0919_09175 [Taibaiella lutea]
MNHIAFFKQLDAGLQVIAFVFSIWAMFQTGYIVLGFLILTGLQLISSTIWSLFFLTAIPKRRLGLWTRRIYIISILFAFLAGVLNHGAFGGLLMIWIYLAPFLCIAYFLVTMKEIVYYLNIRKPYYLL